MRNAEGGNGSTEGWKLRGWEGGKEVVNCGLGVARKKGIEQRAECIQDIEEFGSRNAECGKKKSQGVVT
jgi:hypothetical protein